LGLSLSTGALADYSAAQRESKRYLANEGVRPQKRPSLSRPPTNVDPLFDAILDIARPPKE
jgi:hypothetical protein